MKYFSLAEFHMLFFGVFSPKKNQPEWQQLVPSSYEPGSLELWNPWPEQALHVSSAAVSLKLLMRLFCGGVSMKPGSLEAQLPHQSASGTSKKPN